MRALLQGVAVATVVLAGTVVTTTSADAQPQGADQSARNAPAESCQMQRLPGPDGTTWTTIGAGSPSGDWLVGSTDVDEGGWKLLIWHNGELQQPKIDVSDFSKLTGISEKGRAVGFAVTNDGQVTHAFAHQSGKSWRLPTLDKRGDASAEAISADGRTAVGSEEVYKNGKRVGVVPVRWTGKRLQNVQRIAVPGQGQASGVHRGAVVGSSKGRAYVWPRDGKPGFLPHASHPSTADAVRGKYAVGEERPADDTTGSALLWNLDRSAATKLPKAVDEAYDVNSSGVVAVEASGDAAVVENGQMRTLPSQGGGGSVTTIAENGTVAGTTYNSSGDANPVMWRGCAS